jgi:hypothetical protein
MNRRSFLEWATAGLYAALGAALALPALGFVLSPVLGGRRRRPAGDAAAAGTGFVRVATLSAVRPDRPVRAAVIAGRVDAYTAHPPRPIGAVWLVSEDPGRDDTPIRCLQVICPHLGCAVDAAGSGFACPCHASDFDRLGRRLSGPSPRDMDTLECRVTPPDESGERWIEVKYEQFAAGVAEKRVIG